MSILTHYEIKNAIESDEIRICPFDPERIGPNSYDLTLDNQLAVYDEALLDCKIPPRIKFITIPPEGLILEPGILYLGVTVEHTSTPFHVPMIEGRSSLGRLGMFVHITAGFGDVGYKGRWTLEISVIHPLRVYPNMRVCQIYFHWVGTHILKPYSGKYQNAEGVIESRLSTEL